MNAPTGVAERLTGLVGALRAHGVRIGTGETVDAAQAVAALGLTDRELLREGLAATLLHSTGQRRVFDPVFDLYFPRLVGAPMPEGRATLRRRPGGAARPARGRARRGRPGDTGAAGDRGGGRLRGLRFVAGVGRLVVVPDARPLRPQTLMARVRDSVSRRQEGAAGFADRLLEDEIRRRIEVFRALVATEARRRVAERRGRDELARRAVAPTVDRVDLPVRGAGPARRAAQDGAAAGAQAGHPARRTPPPGRARHHRPAADPARFTVHRRGADEAGAAQAPPRPARTGAAVRCVGLGGGLLGLHVLLVQALHDQFSKVRVFAFVNRIDEVTGLLVHGTADPEGLGARIRSEATLTGWHGGGLRRRVRRVRQAVVDAVGPRTTVFVLGDARTNMGDPNVPAVRRFSERARRVYWLNPEPLSQSGYGRLGGAGVRRARRDARVPQRTAAQRADRPTAAGPPPETRTGPAAPSPCLTRPAAGTSRPGPRPAGP